MKVGILGSTGYAGTQLVQLLHKHPEAEIKFLGSFSQQDRQFGDINRRFSREMEYTCVDPSTLEENTKDLDLVFLALPHTKSMEWAQKFIEKGIPVIDLSGDFRLDCTFEYEQWYRADHNYKLANENAVYGLPELHGKNIKKSKLIANPGCYPTASILGLAPLADKDLIVKNSVIIDAKSGISGVGKKAIISNIYCEASENTKAYGIGNHRHTPEIEQEISKLAGITHMVQFTPNVVPMHRGILSNIYVKMTEDYSEYELYKLFMEFYKDAPFVRISDELPETKFVSGTNYCDIAIRKDERTNTVIIFSAIDNLLKGAAGQAIQNMNIMFGLDETTGLTGL